MNYSTTHFQYKDETKSTSNQHCDWSHAHCEDKCIHLVTTICMIIIFLQVLWEGSKFIQLSHSYYMNPF